MKKIECTWILAGVSLLWMLPALHAEAGGDTRPILAATCQINNATLEKLFPSTTSAGCKLDVTIPPGKRWVIEVVQARCTLDGDSTPPAITSVQFMPFRQTSINGYDGSMFYLTDSITTSGQFLNVVRRTWTGSLRGPLYTDLPPRFDAERLSGMLDYAACRFSASGYLIDKPLQ